MAQLVIGMGHRHLALISAEVAQNDRARERLEGIKQAMQENNLDPDDLEVVETQYGIDNGVAAFNKLMTPQTKITAVLCGNDVLAVGALRAARELGLDVPGDVSIVGFDDIEIAQVAYPPLTTVHVPHREMGKQAAQALVDLLHGSGPITAQELTSELRIRASLGPASTQDH